MTQQLQNWFKKIDWPVALFLVSIIAVSLVFAPIYFYHHGLEWGLLAFTLVFAALTNLSVTAGYHRLFSHKSYEAHPIAKAIFLLIAASGWQGSALKWSSDHRRHHSFIDTEKDPYNIGEGFWYAHIGWLFLKSSVDQKIHAPDLEKDKLVVWQHRFFIPLAILTGFGFPTLIGYFMGSAWGGFLIAGVLRIVLTQQSTFFVNSLCHTLGQQTYCTQISARDSLFVAFLTHGEGYHNFHHKFQIDFRNGIRWYQWDPTKWTILSLKFMGLADRLRMIPQTEILKAKLSTEEVKLKMSGYAEEKIQSIKDNIISAQEKIKKLKEDYHLLTVEYHKRKDLLYSNYEQKLREIQKEIKLAQIELKMGLRQWNTLITY